jgi:site-specific DNA-cytosine methylase
MITPQTDKKYTVVHAFSGSGGCSSGFDEEGFETLAALDFDADACADLDYLLNRKVAVVVDIEKMEPADMRRIVGDRRPDVYVATPPCKGWSRLLGKGRRMSDKYVRMCSLAVRSVWLALHAWDEPPPLIVIENVRGMSTEGREMMDIIKRELRAFGYLFDIRTHNVGKLGHLAQSRERCLFVARDPKRCPAFLMVPDSHPLRPCGDELGKLPPPTLDKASKSMHKLPQLSAMNWLRIAAIPPGKDWKALPPRIQLGGDPKNRHDSKFGVEDWNAPAHTVTGVGSRVPSGRSAVAHPVPVDYADPRAGRAARASRATGTTASSTRASQRIPSAASTGSGRRPRATRTRWPRSDDGSPEDEARPQGHGWPGGAVQRRRSDDGNDPRAGGPWRRPADRRPRRAAERRLRGQRVGRPSAHGRRPHRRQQHVGLHRDADHLHAELVRWP